VKGLGDEIISPCLKTLMHRLRVSVPRNEDKWYELEVNGLSNQSAEIQRIEPRNAQITDDELDIPDVQAGKEGLMFFGANDGESFEYEKLGKGVAQDPVVFEEQDFAWFKWPNHRSLPTTGQPYPDGFPKHSPLRILSFKENTFAKPHTRQPGNFP
jgi:hypothetical protein